MNFGWEEIGKSIISFLFSVLKVVLPGYAAACVINIFVTRAREKSFHNTDEEKINGFYYISWHWVIKALMVFAALFFGFLWYMSVREGIQYIIETGTIDTTDQSVRDFINWTLFWVPMAVLFGEGLEFVLWQLRFDDETIYYRNSFGVTRKYRFSDIDFVSGFSPGVIGNDYDVVYGKGKKLFRIYDMLDGALGTFFANLRERNIPYCEGGGDLYRGYSCSHKNVTPVTQLIKIMSWLVYELAVCGFSAYIDTRSFTAKFLTIVFLLIFLCMRFLPESTLYYIKGDKFESCGLFNSFSVDLSDIDRVETKFASNNVVHYLVCTENYKICSLDGNSQMGHPVIVNELISNSKKGKEQAEKVREREEKARRERERRKELSRQKRQQGNKKKEKSK